MVQQQLTCITMCAWPNKAAVMGRDFMILRILYKRVDIGWRSGKRMAKVFMQLDCQGDFCNGDAKSLDPRHPDDPHFVHSVKLITQYNYFIILGRSHEKHTAISDLHKFSDGKPKKKGCKEPEAASDMADSNDIEFLLPLMEDSHSEGEEGKEDNVDDGIGNEEIAASLPTKLSSKQKRTQSTSKTHTTKKTRQDHPVGNKVQKMSVWCIGLPHSDLLINCQQGHIMFLSSLLRQCYPKFYGLCSGQWAFFLPAHSFITWAYLK
ncbi:hypothetical protein BDQ17DRAFT_1329546 [Cyathus striatus]|nr:hypothetical protein BDQ17DRAFT_1329546 [Cyathus striatus]